MVTKFVSVATNLVAMEMHDSRGKQHTCASIRSKARQGDTSRVVKAKNREATRMENITRRGFLHLHVC